MDRLSTSIRITSEAYRNAIDKEELVRIVLHENIHELFEAIAKRIHGGQIVRLSATISEF
jgi:hypothetical protein